MMNIAEIIVNQFLELDPKDFPSNKILENNNQNEEKFEEILNEKQLANYRQLANEISYYYTAHAEKLVEFTLEFLSEILNFKAKC